MIRSTIVRVFEEHPNKWITRTEALRDVSDVADGILMLDHLVKERTVRIRIQHYRRQQGMVEVFRLRQESEK